MMMQSFVSMGVASIIWLTAQTEPGCLVACVGCGNYGILKILRLAEVPYRLFPVLRGESLHHWEPVHTLWLPGTECERGSESLQRFAREKDSH